MHYKIEGKMVQTLGNNLEGASKSKPSNCYVTMPTHFCKELNSKELKTDLQTNTCAQMTGTLL